MFGKYTLPLMLQAYKDNQPLIQAHLRGESAEGATEDGTMVMGLGVSAFLAIFLMSIIFYGGVGWYMYKNWDSLSDVAKILAALAYLGVLGGPVIALIIVVVMKDKQM